MKHLNKLSKETSPYLLQHMKNPVDWYPWCSDSLKKAKDKGKVVISFLASRRDKDAFAFIDDVKLIYLGK